MTGRHEAMNRAVGQSLAARFDWVRHLTDPVLLVCGRVIIHLHSWRNIMSKKRHSHGPVPPGNRPRSGPPSESPDSSDQSSGGDGTGFQDQDPKRRLGDFTGTGEHSRQQPGPLNDGGSRHGEDAG